MGKDCRVVRFPGWQHTSYKAEEFISELVSDRPLIESIHLIDSKGAALLNLPEKGDSHGKEALQQLIADNTLIELMKLKLGDVKKVPLIVLEHFTSYSDQKTPRTLVIVAPLLNDLKETKGALISMVPINNLHSFSVKNLNNEHIKLRLLKDNKNILSDQNQVLANKGTVANSAVFTVSNDPKYGKDMEYSIELSEKEEMIFRHVNKTINQIILLVALSSLLVFVISIMLARWLTSPLKKMTDIVTLYASGKYDSNTKIDTFSEFQRFNSVLISMGKNILEKIKNLEEAKAIIEDQNKNLESKVEERTAQLQGKTRDIESMLENMKLGIFTIHHGNTIHKEYSLFLETIFEQHKLEGKNAINLLFDKADLSLDKLDQAKTVIEGAINEDETNFMVNDHLLPDEISADINGKKKILELSWDSICSFENKNIVEKIMVSVRDVTELRDLQQKDKQNRKELQVIDQILAVTPQKFERFITEATDYLERAKKEIIEHPSYNRKAIDLLFRYIHTIKGNARSFNFTLLTDTLHSTESHCDQYRKTEGEDWDQQFLLSCIEKIYEEVNSYLKVYQEKLKSALNEEEQLYHDIVGSCRALVKNAIHHPENQSGVLEKLEKACDLTDTISLSQILSDIERSLPQLATTVGKKHPNLNITEKPYRFSNDMGRMLRDVFTHCIRNSLDHGIEYDDERRKSNKKARGNIWIDVSEGRDNCVLKYQDDGKGLDLFKLKKMGISKGFINHSCNDLEVAETIFSADVSTSETVTQISGRGVGMDAVKTFLEDQGCSIQIEFLDDNEGGHFRQFRFLIDIPSKKVFEASILQLAS